MQGLLNGLIESMRVSLLLNRGPQPLIVFLSNGLDVERETPDANWYTVHGWPDAVISRSAQKLAPRSLTPPASKAPHLYPPLSEALGTMQVEVLEATGMVRTDLFSENDVYAVVMLEGHAVQTLTLMDARHPRWNPEDARAVRLPVWSPFATLFVGLFDADFSKIKHDDPLGRVEIEPRTLNPESVYTSWLPLHRRLRSNAAPCGHVRLRYSVTWNSLPQRLLSYTLRPPTELTIALASTADKSRAMFTAAGVQADRRYDWNQLQAYLDELLATLELVKELYPSPSPGPNPSPSRARARA